jgi:hypothetical protein
MEYEQEEDQNDVVGELTPALHQECIDYCATSVHAVLTRGKSTVGGLILHTNSCRHRVFTTDSNTIRQ